jgi:hypothetical protein
MSKYDPLGDFLRRQRTETVTMTFAQIEKLIGSKLPASAEYRAWWSNNAFNSVMTQIWLDAGFKSEQVDIDAGKLVFRRVRAPSVQPEKLAHEGHRHPLLGALKGLIEVKPGTDLTAPVDPSWGKR